MAAKILQKITQWSFSRWKAWDECPFKAKKLFIDKVKTPGSAAMDRGDQIHKAAELFVRGETTEIHEDLKKVKHHLVKLKKMGAMPELMLATDKNWKETGWFSADTWCRIKVDVLALLKPVKGVKRAKVKDYKTGQFKPDSDDYALQLSLYATGVLSIHTDVDEVETSLLFTDHNEEVSETYDRSELPILQKAWEDRTKPMLNDTLFVARPGMYCRWCHFSKAKGGPCAY